MQTTEQRANQIGAGVFIIGLGIIAFANYWWPGIMFVIGASLLANEYVQTGGNLSLASGRVVGAGVVILIGLTGLIRFNFGQLWPIVLIGVGLAMLAGRGSLPSWTKQCSDREKSKRQ